MPSSAGFTTQMQTQESNLCSESDPKTAAAYIRVSTDDQIEYSPEAQLVEIRKYAAAHGYMIPEDLIFIDEGLSGKRTVKREKFNLMIGVAKTKPKPFDAILLWKFSRFARNREDSVVYKSMLRKQLGIEVISVSEPVGDDKMAVIVEALIEAMDEYYSINLAEEVKRGMSEKARRGELQSGPSFGYRADAKKNMLLIVPEEAALVRDMFQRYLSGEGFYQIARWLNSLGITTHRGNRFENRTVEYILRNPVYIGKLRWNPEGRMRRQYDMPTAILADAMHEPIVTQEVWDAVQKRIKQQKSLKQYHSRPSYDRKDWLSGIVRCASCGTTLVFVKPHYLKCNNYIRGRCTHSQHINVELLHEAMINRIHRDAMADIKPHVHILRKLDQSADERGVIERNLANIGRKKARLRDAFLCGADSMEEYAEMKQALAQEEVRLTERLSVLRAAASAPAAAALLRKQLEQSLDVLLSPDLALEQKYEALNAVIENCTFDKEQNLLSIIYRPAL